MAWVNLPVNAAGFAHETANAGAAAAAATAGTVQASPWATVRRDREGGEAGD